MSNPADRDQLGRIATAFTRLGITDRADRLRLLSDAVDRELYSSSKLTSDEADAIEQRLRTARPPALRAHLAALVRAEEAKAADRARAAGVPAGTILCGPKPPTDDDLAKVAEFAAALAERGPAPDPIDTAVANLRDAGLITEETHP